MAIAPDGVLAVVGEISESENANKIGSFFQTRAPSGVVITTTYSTQTLARAVAHLSNDRFVIGRSISAVGDNSESRLLVADSSGVVVHQRNCPNDGICSSPPETGLFGLPDGTFLSLAEDRIARFDDEINEIWSMSLTTEHEHDLKLSTVAANSVGDILVAGNVDRSPIESGDNPPTPVWVSVVARLSSEGNLLWQEEFEGDEKSIQARSVLVQDDGQIIVSGNQGTLAHRDPWMVFLSPEGTVLGVTELPGDDASGLQMDGVVISGKANIDPEFYRITSDNGIVDLARWEAATQAIVWNNHYIAQSGSIIPRAGAWDSAGMLLYVGGRHEENGKMTAWLCSFVG